MQIPENAAASSVKFAPIARRPRAGCGWRLWAIAGALAWLSLQRVKAADPNETQPGPAWNQPESRLVVRNQGYFPVALRLQDGRVAAVLRGGAPHLGIGGRLDLVVSSDAGATWGPPTVVADGPLDDRNPAFGQAANGALVVGFWENSLYDAQGNYAPNATKPTRTLVTRSTDNGRRWSPPEAIDLGPLKYGSPYGRMLTLPDGRLLMPVYGELIGQRSDSSCLFASTDHGVNWKLYSVIASNGFNETAVLELAPGHLLAALRHDRRSGGGENVWLAESSDTGLHWSAPKSLTPDSVHPADLTLLPDGRVLLVSGDRRQPCGVVGVISDPQYNFNWAAARPLATDAINSDCGYPSTVLLPDGSVLTLYYSVGNRQHPEWGVHCAAIKYHPW